MSRYLVAGLGNPGRKYRDTRHNIGFMVADRLAERHRMRLSENKFNGQFASGRLAGQKAYLVKPQTFMNRSGESIGEAARYHDIPVEQIIVIHDDVDLDLGRLAVKVGGGHGGHNGLRSIVDHISSKGFVRVRCGVGRPEHGDVTDHVLGRFESSEMNIVDRVVELACDAVETILRDGPREAQNEFNGRDVS